MSFLFWLESNQNLRDVVQILMIFSSRAPHHFCMSFRNQTVPGKAWKTLGTTHATCIRAGVIPGRSSSVRCYESHSYAWCSTPGYRSSPLTALLLAQSRSWGPKHHLRPSSRPCFTDLPLGNTGILETQRDGEEMAGREGTEHGL